MATDEFERDELTVTLRDRQLISNVLRQAKRENVNPDFFVEATIRKVDELGLLKEITKPLPLGGAVWGTGNGDNEPNKN